MNQDGRAFLEQPSMIGVLRVCELSRPTPNLVVPEIVMNHLMGNQVLQRLPREFPPEVVDFEKDPGDRTPTAILLLDRLDKPEMGVFSREDSNIDLLLHLGPTLRVEDFALKLEYHALPTIHLVRTVSIRQDLSDPVSVPTELPQDRIYLDAVLWTTLLIRPFTSANPGLLSTQVRLWSSIRLSLHSSQ